MANESALFEVVRAWAVKQYGCDPNPAERVAGVAARAYAGGASVADACQLARAYLGSWMAHPSYLAACRAIEEPIAS